MEKTKFDIWREKAEAFFEYEVDENCACYHNDSKCSGKACPMYQKCRCIGLEGNALGFKMVD